MMRDSFHAMGTTIEVIAHDARALAASRALFEDHEARFSRFRPDSELCVINASDADTIEVSKPMADLLGKARDLAGRTDGLVDPSVGGAVRAWGYDRTFTEISDVSHRPSQAWPEPWSIDDRVLRRPPGTLLDLGGLAKGWTADLAVDPGPAMLVSAGGDVRSRLGDATVEIVEGPRAVTVQLGEGALATSSVSRRRWRVGDSEAHHIIDPRTGEPAETPISTASASCATAVEAEAAAKAVLLMGADGLAWADRQPWIASAMALWADGSIYATTGWEVAA